METEPIADYNKETLPTISENVADPKDAQEGLESPDKEETKGSSGKKN